MATGQCFRMVLSDGGWSAGPARCAEPVAWHGTYVDGFGGRQLVRCCDEHVAEVEDAVAIDRIDQLVTAI